MTENRFSCRATPPRCPSFFLLLSHVDFPVFSQWFVVIPPQVSQDWNLWSVPLRVCRTAGVGEDTSHKRGAFLAYTGASWIGITPGSLSANAGVSSALIWLFG